ncbi:MAG: hypothetical protein ABEJ56_01465 [Candidatus Nanohaloarchaea archaeon]
MSVSQANVSESQSRDSENETVEEMLEEDDQVEETLSYDDFRESAVEDWEENYEENSNVDASSSEGVGIGIESENPILNEEGVMPLSPVYQQILNEELWSEIDSELRERTDEYGEEFEFELDKVVEKGHGGQKPAALKLDLTEDSDQDIAVSTPEIDFDLGAQQEIDSGAVRVTEDGEFGLLLAILESFKEGTKNYLEREFPALEYAEEGLTPQFTDPEEVPDETDGRDVIKRGKLEEWERDEALAFLNQYFDHFTDVPYYFDYMATIFGPKVALNMFGGSTQLTSGLFADENGNLDLDQRISDEIVYRMLFERGLETVSSNTKVEYEGETSRTAVNQVYWEHDTYAQHVISEIEGEDKQDRVGTPWTLIEKLLDEEREMGEFENMMDHYMTEHHMVWVLPPDEEYVEFYGDEELELEDVTLLALSPDDAKTPAEYIEDGDIEFTKVVNSGSDQEPELERVRGKVDLKGMDEERKDEYHKRNVSIAHMAGIHHDVRPKPATGGFEYRVSRQNYDDEYQVALAKAAVMPHGEKIRQAFEKEVEGLDPSDPETLPGLDEEEKWMDIYRDVYDSDVMDTAGAMAPSYAGDLEAHLEDVLGLMPATEYGENQGARV